MQRAGVGSFHPDRHDVDHVVHRGVSGRSSAARPRRFRAGVKGEIGTDQSPGWPPPRRRSAMGEGLRPVPC